MMIRSRTPSCSAGGIAGGAGAVDTAGPGAGWEFVTGGTTANGRGGIPRAAAASRPAVLAGAVDDDLGQVAAEALVAGHQPGDPDQHEPAGRRLVEGQVGGAVHRAAGGDGVAVERTVRVATGADLDGDPRRGGGQRHPGDVLVAAEVVHDPDAVLEVAERGRAPVLQRRPRRRGVVVVAERDVAVVLRLAVALRVVDVGADDGDRGAGLRGVAGTRRGRRADRRG